MTTTTSRAVPRRGGFSGAFLMIELRRMVRNKRTLIFTLLLPPMFFLIFGLQSDYKTQPYGNGNVTGYVMISMAVYGAMLGTTSGGAMVSIERGLGWSRQLRLTPLKPAAYIVTKIIVAMVLGIMSVAVVFAIGAAFGAQMSPTAWVASFLIAWITSIVFAAFGLFMGYLLPSENVMQILGPGLAVLSFAGGLFIPPTGWFETASRFFPTYGVAILSRAPLGDNTTGSMIAAVINLVFWSAVFMLGARELFRRDTARV